MKHVEEIADVLEKLCQRIARYPDNIRVICACTVHTANIRIMSHPEDTMKLIGTGGATARAFEFVAGLMAESIDMKLRLRVEPTERVQQEWLPFKADPKYNGKIEAELLRRIVAMIYDDGAMVEIFKVNHDTTALIARFDGHADEFLEEALGIIFTPAALNHGQNMYVEVDAK